MFETWFATMANHCFFDYVDLHSMHEECLYCKHLISGQ